MVTRDEWWKVREMAEGGQKVQTLTYEISKT